VAIALSSLAASVRSEAIVSKDHDIITISSSHTDDQATASMPVHDPVGWAGIDDALFSSISVPQNRQRDAAPMTRARPWGRLFVDAMTVPHDFNTEDDNGRYKEQGEGSEGMTAGCITCPRGGDLVCINATHFGYCDEGCVEPRRVREDVWE
jgi:hypothetical protein